jgi:hypothetical protein
MCDCECLAPCSIFLWKMATRFIEHVRVVVAKDGDDLLLGTVEIQAPGVMVVTNTREVAPVGATPGSHCTLGIENLFATAKRQKFTCGRGELVNVGQHAAAMSSVSWQDNA